MKIIYAALCISPSMVAPRVGAWIEIKQMYWLPEDLLVAPRVGAWIEKVILLAIGFVSCVAPRVGAWIEKYSHLTLTLGLFGRSSRRSVD